MKVVLYRKSRTNVNLFKHFVGQHERKVVDVLEDSEYIVRYIHALMLRMS